MTIRTYSSPEAFKQALEQRLRTSAKSGAEFARKRQLLVFDRFLARVVVVLGDSATLKGGLVLELRIGRARTTKDVDLRVVGSPDEILARLQDAGRRDLGDFLTFEIGPDEDHPEIQNDGTQYDGLRFRAECKLAGKVYGQPFGVDVAFGDPILGEPEIVVAEDVLAFAGIAPPTLRLYPIETHIAEKLHAYTIPRSRPNSRVKDLPDIALLATAQPLDAKRLRAALEQTFTFRKTHALPPSVPAPPRAWTTPCTTSAGRGGAPLDIAKQLKADHAAIAALLVPTPTPDLIAKLRDVLAVHNPLEEGPGGLYELCEGLAGEESAALLSRIRAIPKVPVAPYFDGPRAFTNIELLLRARTSADVT